MTDLIAQATALEWAADQYSRMPLLEAAKRVTDHAEGLRAQSAAQPPAAQPDEPDNAIAIVSSDDADSVYATVQWLLNPLPGGSLLFERPDPRMTKEELSLKCAGVLGWEYARRPGVVTVPSTGDPVQDDQLHESPAAVLAMICELGKRGVRIEPSVIHSELYGWVAYGGKYGMPPHTKVSDHPTPDAALARCVMLAICEVMG